MSTALAARPMRFAAFALLGQFFGLADVRRRRSSDGVERTHAAKRIKELPYGRRASQTGRTRLGDFPPIVKFFPIDPLS
jgi:hypothetical protein